MTTTKKVLAVIAAGTFIFGVSACDTDTGSDGSNTGNGGTGVLNDEDEAQDVVKVERKDERFLGTTAVVTVKNSSEKTSDYMIEVTAESPNGSKQYESTTVLIDNVKPGQTADGDGLFVEKVPQDAKITVGSVDRTESL